MRVRRSSAAFVRGESGVVEAGGRSAGAERIVGCTDRLSGSDRVWCKGRPGLVQRSFEVMDNSSREWVRWGGEAWESHFAIR